MILVVAEQQDGVLSRVTWETIAAAIPPKKHFATSSVSCFLRTKGVVVNTIKNSKFKIKNADRKTEN